MLPAEAPVSENLGVHCYLLVVLRQLRQTPHHDPMAAILKWKDHFRKSLQVVAQLLAQGRTVDLVQGRSAEQLALERKTEIADPALNAQKVVVRDHCCIDHHDVSGGWFGNLGNQVLPEGDQHSHCANVEKSFCAKVADDEAAVADLITGLLKQVPQSGQRSLRRNTVSSSPGR